MKKLVLLMMIVCMAIPCFAGSPFNIWTRPDADWLTGQTPNFDPAWAWMKWMDGMVSPPGDVFYVDNDNGSATNDGLSWNRAKETITQGMALITKNHSTLYVGGTSYQENVITPTGVSGGRILGVSNSRGLPLWQAASTTGDVHLTIISPEWEVAGFRFHGSTNNVPFLRVHSNAGSSYNAHAAVIRDCWFSGATAYAAIEFVGGPTSCKILRNKITGFTTGTGIWEGAVSGNDYVQAAVMFEIIDNQFANNVKNLNLMMNASLVKGNTFATASGSSATTVVISTYAGSEPGGGGGGNIITGNVFEDMSFRINNTNGYYGSSNDTWSGNICPDGLTIERYPESPLNHRSTRIHYISDTTSIMTTTDYGDADSPVEIFAVTGDILCRAFAIVDADCTSASNGATLELGVVGNTASLLIQDQVDGATGHNAFKENDAWTKATAVTMAAAEVDHDWLVISNGLSIDLTIATQDMASGVITFYLQWIPISADANVVGVAP